MSHALSTNLVTSPGAQVAPIPLVATAVPPNDDRLKRALDIYVKAHLNCGWMVPELARAHDVAQRILKG